MADVHSKKVRSYNMSRIKSKDTKPELIVRKFLFSKGFRFRLHDKKLPGKPDIVLRRYKTAIFIHGCFWHAHEECKYAVMPKSNREYWLPKITNNKVKDIAAHQQLVKMNWKVIVVWECMLKKAVQSEILDRLVKDLIT